MSTGGTSAFVLLIVGTDDDGRGLDVGRGAHGRLFFIFESELFPVRRLLGWRCEQERGKARRAWTAMPNLDLLITPDRSLKAT